MAYDHESARKIVYERIIAPRQALERLLVQFREVDRLASRNGADLPHINRRL